MSTTTVTPDARSSTTSIASSAKFRTFAIAFSLSSPVIYTLSELLSLPLFTYHPATDRIEFGWAPGRSGEGPAMYWYGWTVGMVLAGAVVGSLATLLPEQATRRIPLALIWILPLLAIVPLAYSLMPFWTKG